MRLPEPTQADILTHTIEARIKSLQQLFNSIFGQKSCFNLLAMFVNQSTKSYLSVTNHHEFSTHTSVHNTESSSNIGTITYVQNITTKWDTIRFAS